MSWRTSGGNEKGVKVHDEVDEDGEVGEDNEVGEEDEVSEDTEDS